MVGPELDEENGLRLALLDLLRSARAYMEYHGEKYREAGLGRPTGLWPAIARAETALLRQPRRPLTFWRRWILSMRLR